jgi:hypothetical protein
MSDKNEFKEWCIVELFGHQKLAGQVTGQTIGGCEFVRIDVPGTENQKAFTKFYGSKAIYSMTPTSEELVMAWLKNNGPNPVNRFEFNLPELPVSIEDRSSEIGFDDDDNHDIGQIEPDDHDPYDDDTEPF